MGQEWRWRDAKLESEVIAFPAAHHPAPARTKRRGKGGTGARRGWTLGTILALLLPLGLLAAGMFVPLPRGGSPDDAAFLDHSTQIQSNGGDVLPAATTTPLVAGRPRPTTPTPTPPVVFLDPGHGGVDTGTIGTTPDGVTLEEKNLALAIALDTAAHLRQDGLTVVLSRTGDDLVGATAADYTADGTALTADGVLADLQRRIDRANASHADVLLSIHLNAFSDPAVGGTQTFYDPARPFGDRNKELATLVQASVVAGLRAHGLDVPDRGATDDEDLQAESLGSLSASYDHLVMLGPAIPGRLRPSDMPGALCEVLFLSNPPEAAAVSQGATQDVVAAAFAQAIEQFLREGGRLA